MFQPKSQQQLLNFALDVFVWGQKQIFGHLLGNRAAALRIAPFNQIDRHSPRKGDNVKTKMLIKTAVFGGNNCFGGIFGQIIRHHHG